MSDNVTQQTPEEIAAAAQVQVREDITALLSASCPDPILYRRLSVQEIHLEICKGGGYKLARELAGVRGLTADMLSFTAGDAPATDASVWEGMLQDVQTTPPDQVHTRSSHSRSSPKKVRAIVDALLKGATLNACSRMFNTSEKTIQRIRDKHIRNGEPLPEDE